MRLGLSGPFLHLIRKDNLTKLKDILMIKIDLSVPKCSLYSQIYYAGNYNKNKFKPENKS